MKLSKVWRICRAALEAVLRQAEQPRKLTAQLRAFLTVPDHALTVAEDAVLLARLEAAIFLISEARDGLLVKGYDPTVTSRDELRAGFRRDGLDIDRLEAAGRFRCCPECEPTGGVTTPSPPTGGQCRIARRPTAELR